VDLSSPFPIGGWRRRASHNVATAASAQSTWPSPIRRHYSVHIHVGGKKWDDGRSVPTRCRPRAARSRRTRVGLCVADNLDDASIRCLQPSRVGGIRGGIERPRQLLPNFRVAQAIACDGSRFRRGATNSDVATRDWPLDAFHVSRCVQPPLPPRAKTSPMVRSEAPTWFAQETGIPGRVVMRFSWSCRYGPLRCIY